MPHAPDGLPRVITGRAAIREMLAGAFATFATPVFTDHCHAVTDDPNLVFAQWTLDIPLRGGGRYVNDGVSVFLVRGGRIHEYIEYCNPQAARAAFLDG